MKKSLILFTALLIFNSVQAQESGVVRLSEPVLQTEVYEVFGSEISEWNDALTLSEIILSKEDYSSKEITVETEVAEVCAKKGCFFIARDGELTARVTFKDYSFFVPTDSQGKSVKLVGVFQVNELTEEQAKHYAEDAGEDPDTITGSQKEYSIVATSVLVPKD